MTTELRETPGAANWGISVIICCYNSAARLPETLGHLSCQRVDGEIPWEVIVVDNNSKDGTAQLATQCWPADASAPLRIVREPKPGVGYARQRGIQESRYEILSFVDDDNWLCAGWLQAAVEIMADYPKVGACGGPSAAVTTVPLPGWFSSYQLCYAVGDQRERAEAGELWTAGMVLRRSAWEQVLRLGFQPFAASRTGGELLSGEDTEMCRALHLAGWRIHYDPRLQIEHFIRADRIEWGYLRRLCRGFGASSAQIDAYRFALGGSPSSLKGRLRRTWLWNVYASARGVLRYRQILIDALRSPMEGEGHVLDLEIGLGRLSQLLKLWKDYDRRVNHITGMFRSPAPVSGEVRLEALSEPDKESSS
jgi:glycosyltransferase involved in cell wall biosynthesis